MAPGKLGESNTQSQSIGLALSRLRTSVVLCCWIIGIALCVQLVIWSLAAYTDMRFQTQDETAAVEVEPQVVVAESPRQQRIREVREADMGIDLSPESPVATSEPQRDTGRMDSMFATIYNLAAGLGRCAMLAIIPLMMVAVMLAAGSATPGIERVVSSLAWGLLAAVLILPLGGPFSLPWDGGALSTYGEMVASVDRFDDAASASEMQTGTTSGGAGDAAAANGSTLGMHLRFGLLPIACIVGITLVGLRFCSGVEAGIESMRLDPALEREAANISPSSLHAGRSTAVLTRTMQSEAEPPSAASARTVSPGQTPQRLI